jgi:hypothetical protein
MLISLALIVCTIYAIVQLIRSSSDFFKYGGKVWQFASLLLLALVALVIFIVPWIPAIPPVARALAVLSWLFVCGALAIVSRICVVLFEASGTSLSHRAEHACNAMFFVAIVRLVLTISSWMFAWLSAYF